MTGPTGVASDRKIAPHVGGSAAFRRFLADELMPQVRQRFRTNGHNAIVGESLAGLFVLETFFAQPELFDTYIAFSPSLWWNDESLSRHAASRLTSWAGLKRTVYVAPASDDGTEAPLARLNAAVRTSAPGGLRWICEPMADMHHSDIYRRASPDCVPALVPERFAEAVGVSPEFERPPDGHRRGSTDRAHAACEPREHADAVHSPTARRSPATPRCRHRRRSASAPSLSCASPTGAPYSSDSSFGIEPGDDRLGLADRLALLEGDEHHLIAAQRRTIPAAVFADERAVLVLRRQRVVSGRSADPARRRASRARSPGLIALATRSGRCGFTRVSTCWP